MKTTVRHNFTERNRGGSPLTESDPLEYPPSRFLSLSPAGRNYRAFPLVTALCSLFVLLIAGAALSLAYSIHNVPDAAGVTLGALFAIVSALTWVNTQSKRHRK
jgi:hypothetical protein